MSGGLGSAPTVVACVRWAENRYHVRPVGTPAAARGAVVDVQADARTQLCGSPSQLTGDSQAWPLVLRLRGCEGVPHQHILPCHSFSHTNLKSPLRGTGRAALEDAAVMVNARADTFFIQPVLSAAQCVPPKSR